MECDPHELHNNCHLNCLVSLACLEERPEAAGAPDPLSQPQLDLPLFEKDLQAGGLSFPEDKDCNLPPETYHMSSDKVSICFCCVYHRTSQHPIRVGKCGKHHACLAISSSACLSTSSGNKAQSGEEDYGGPQRCPT